MENKQELKENINTKPINVLLCSVFTDSSKEQECLSRLEELRLLAETSIGDDAINSSFYKLTQCRPHPDVATYLGSGKAIEAGEICENNDISLVVIDGEMSPSQIRNLENEINSKSTDKEVRVIDRTMLILDIFAKHAVTGEGKLQVEIAQLKYTAPRLTGKGIALSRQGGTSGSIGARGPGETKLETDKRHIQKRILALKDALREMESDRNVKRSKRVKSDVPTAVISGYTNAGKSTLLNYLTGAGILAENKLFATLDPTVRKMSLPSGKTVLLSDTVGFISRLPHQLVESFKSTLDEVRYADIILVVADASDPEMKNKIIVTEQILGELDSADKPKIYVLNKCDVAGDYDLPEISDSARTVCISALTGEGTDELLSVIDEELAKSKKTVTFLFSFEMQSAVNNLYENATVLNVEYVENGALVTAVVDDKCYGMYKKFEKE